MIIQTFPPATSSFNHDLNDNLGGKNAQKCRSESSPQAFSPVRSFKIRDFDTCYWSISCLDKHITRNNSNPPVAALGTRMDASLCKLWMDSKSNCYTGNPEMHTCSTEHATLGLHFGLFQCNTQNRYTHNTL